MNVIIYIVEGDIIKWLKVLNKIFDILFVIFVILCLIVAIVPFIFHTKLYVVVSGSMIPTINVGDLVASQKIDANSLKRGDIVSYKLNNVIVTHRIKSINKSTKSIITKGDNNNIEDPAEVEYNQVIGKVVLIVPVIGYMFTFISENGVFLCIAILIIGYSLNYINKIYEKKSSRIKS